MNLSNKIKTDFLPYASKFVVKNKKSIKIWALVIVSGAMIINGIMQQPQIIKNKQEIADLTDSINYEDERVREVERREDIVGTDEYVEKEARDRLGMVKMGEKIFVDVSKDN